MDEQNKDHWQYAGNHFIGEAILPENAFSEYLPTLFAQFSIICAMYLLTTEALEA